MLKLSVVQEGQSRFGLPFSVKRENGEVLSQFCSQQAAKDEVTRQEEIAALLTHLAKQEQPTT